jgi:hypothetical protein
VPDRILYTCRHWYEQQSDTPPAAALSFESGAPVKPSVFRGVLPYLIGRVSKLSRGISVAQLARVIQAEFSAVKETRMAPATEDVLRRVQGEFLEMPGLRLTEAQARRLWGLDAASCAALLGALVDAKFLFRTRDGAFMRVEHATPMKASLATRSRIAAA